MKKFIFTIGSKVTIEIEALDSKSAWEKLSLILTHQSYALALWQE